MIGGFFFGLSCFEERVKEASSSEAPQKKGPVRTYSDSLERPRSVPMQSHLGSVVLCLISTYSWLGSKFFRTFTRIVVKMYNLCRVKTNRLAVLTVKSGLDPHMINKLKDGIKSLSGYFLWPC